MTDALVLGDESHSVASLSTAAPSPISMEGWGHAWQVAKTLARSAMIPQDYRGKPENCMIALEAAHRLGLSPLPVMSHLYVVHGRPAWEAQFLIALVNSRAGLQKQITWDVDDSGGKRGLTVTAWAIREDGERVEESVTWARAEAEGWTKKDKYKTMPVIMLKYRAATALVKQHWPHLLLGFGTEQDAASIDATGMSPAVASIAAGVTGDPPAIHPALEAAMANADPDATVAAPMSNSVPAGEKRGAQGALLIDEGFRALTDEEKAAIEAEEIRK